MSDIRLLEDIAVQILKSIDKVERRFRGIKTANDFLRDDEGEASCLVIANENGWIVACDEKKRVFSGKHRKF